MNIKQNCVVVILLASALLTGCNSDEKLNSPPKLGANSFVTETDVAFSDRLVAEDPDGDMLTYALSAQPNNGTVMFGTDGSFTYTPAAEFTGMDSFSVIVNDGALAASGVVNVRVDVATVSFLSYSRAAFAQSAEATPLPLNGRTFTADADAEADYSDLIDGQ